MAIIMKNIVRVFKCGIMLGNAGQGKGPGKFVTAKACILLHFNGLNAGNYC